MSGTKDIEEFLEKCKKEKPKPTYRDLKASGFIKRKFGWIKKVVSKKKRKSGVTIVYYDNRK